MRYGVIGLALERERERICGGSGRGELGLTMSADVTGTVGHGRGLQGKQMGVES